MALIGKMGRCSDVAETIAARQRKLKAATFWPWRTKSAVEIETGALCDVLVDGANGLARALEKRGEVVDERMTSYAGKLSLKTTLVDGINLTATNRRSIV